jgi:hypothetical protein
MVNVLFPGGETVATKHRNVLGLGWRLRCCSLFLIVSVFHSPFIRAKDRRVCGDHDFCFEKC